jgi:succinate dehydrogenase / fumarate reductase, iron-sulfur subunit
MKSFPIIKDLVTDVSWNFKVAKKIPELKPRPRDADGHWRMKQEDIDRIQEFRKCIECFLCQDVCHVLRDHHKTDEFVGPRFLIHLATLDMHPLDTVDRKPMMKEEFGLGYCNITRCCTEVCPEHIVITDNGIIPLKERVADEYYDPVRWVLGKVFPPKTKKSLPVLQGDKPSATTRNEPPKAKKKESADAGE